MSMFKIINKTGSDSIQDWCSFTFPNDVMIDLLDSGTYGELEVEYNLRIDLDDIIGIRHGSYFENIASLIRTGEWTLNDGDIDLNKADALLLLKYGNLSEVKTKEMPSGLSGWSSVSHNFSDMTEWTEGESKWVVSPIAGRKLHLTGSKVILDKFFNADDDIYFRVFMDYEVAPGVIQNIMVRQDLYTSINDLKLGASFIYESPAINASSPRGSQGLVHIKYDYAEYITLDSKLNMRLEIGFKDNKELPQTSFLKIRLEGKSEVV